MADYSYLQHVMEENAKLSAQIALLLPWARLGARTGDTWDTADLTWDDAQRLLDRIASGEFGEVK
jgi:hypothetical protein